jgi:hypothetical protein
MATNISEFRSSIRAALNDYDPDVPLYESSAIDAAIELVLNRGLVTGTGGTSGAYTFSAATVVPSLTPTSDATAWARLVMHTAKQFVAGLRRESFRTKQFSTQVGEAHQQIAEVLEGVFDLENSEQAI